MNVLFLHQNFPAQFIHLANLMRRTESARAVAVADARNRRPSPIPIVYYREKTGASDQGKSASLRSVERAQAVASALRGLKTKGFCPDVIIGHFGWGETLLVRDVFPNAKLIIYAEYFYRPHGTDIGFDPEFPFLGSPRLNAFTKNAVGAASLIDADICVAPTKWQAQLFPKEFHSKIAIIHDGIKTKLAAPDANAAFHVDGANIKLTARDEVITFVNRNLEPYRGYHIFMRALPGILAARPKARVVIVGGDGVSYGPSAPTGTTWKEMFFDEVKERLSGDRLHFVGKLPYQALLELFKVSSVHVYLTYPFVLSWSLLEAMSAGAVVVASKTPPVEEVVAHGVNGILFDFFDPGALSDAVIRVLESPDRYTAMRAAARQTIIEKYDVKDSLQRWSALIQSILKAKV